MRTSSIDKIEEGRYNVTSLPCPHCNTTMTTEISGDKLYASHRGAYVQDTLSHLSPADRERYISGTCGSCWNGIFGSDDDEDGDDELAEYGLTDNAAAAETLAQTIQAPPDRGSDPNRRPGV